MVPIEEKESGASAEWNCIFFGIVFWLSALDFAPGSSHYCQHCKLCCLHFYSEQRSPLCIGPLLGLCFPPGTSNNNKRLQKGSNISREFHFNQQWKAWIESFKMEISSYAAGCHVDPQNKMGDSHCSGCYYIGSCTRALRNHAVFSSSDERNITISTRVKHRKDNSKYIIGSSPSAVHQKNDFNYWG